MGRVSSQLPSSQLKSVYFQYSPSFGFLGLRALRISRAHVDRFRSFLAQTKANTTRLDREPSQKSRGGRPVACGDKNVVIKLKTSSERDARARQTPRNHRACGEMAARVAAIIIQSVPQASSGTSGDSRVARCHQTLCVVFSCKHSVSAAGVVLVVVATSVEPRADVPTPSAMADAIEHPHVKSWHASCSWRPSVDDDMIKTKT